MTGLDRRTTAELKKLADALREDLSGPEPFDTPEAETTTRNGICKSLPNSDGGRARQLTPRRHAKEPVAQRQLRTADLGTLSQCRLSCSDARWQRSRPRPQHRQQQLC
jgi:hypothetical protein